MTIRAALPGDVAGIARVQVASWESAYRGRVPDAIFDHVDVEFRTSQWARYFQRPPERTAVWVALSADEVVGMSSVGPNRDDDIVGDDVGELFAIYVDPAHWDRGYGCDLMVTALEGLRDLDFHQGTLWVLDTNERGRRFYERGGWIADGHVKVDDSFGFPLTEVRYRIDL